MNLMHAREAIFGKAVSCRQFLPAAFVPGVLAGNVLQSVVARSDTLLRGLAAAEEARHEEGDDATPADAAVRRLEAKLDLVASMLARTIRSTQSRDPQVELEWSACGACIPSAEAIAPGTPGQFRIEPNDRIPEVLLLPARVLACEPAPAGQLLWIGFESLSAPLQTSLERHLFRIHRRSIAEQRRNTGQPPL